MIFDRVVTREESGTYETELYLKSVCEDYGFDYETVDKDFSYKPTYIKEDGFIARAVQIVKDIFAAIIKFIVALWKGILGIFTAIYSFGNSIYKRLAGIKSEEKIEATFFTSDFKLKKLSFDNTDALKSFYDKSNKELSANIQKISKNNIEFIKKFEVSATKEVTTEALQYLEEKVIINSKFVGNVDPVALRNLNKNIRKDYKAQGLSRHQAPQVKSSVLGDPDTTKVMLATDLFSGVEVSFKQQSTYENGDLLARLMSSDIDILDADHLKLIQEAEDVEKAYIDFANGVIKNISDWQSDYLKHNGERFEKGSKIKRAIVTAIEDPTYDKLKTSLPLVSDDTIVQFLRETTFPRFDDIPDHDKKIEAIKLWCQLKTNWTNKRIMCMKRAIALNTEEFKNRQASIGRRLDPKDIKSVKAAIEKIKENDNALAFRFAEIVPKYTRMDGQIFDGRKIGLGVMIFSIDMVTLGDLAHREILYLKDMDARSSDSLITETSLYDLVLVSHGDHEFNPDTGFDDWHMEPTYTINGAGPYEWVVPWLEKCLEEDPHIRRVHLRCCNGGGKGLPDYIVKSKKLLVHYGEHTQST